VTICNNNSDVTLTLTLDPKINGKFKKNPIVYNSDIILFLRVKLKSLLFCLSCIMVLAVVLLVVVINSHH